MPETITRDSPIIVEVIDGGPRGFLWMPLARLVDETGKFLRFKNGKVFGPKDGKPGQKFEYVGDPAGLEDDPHLKILSDPDGLVGKAIAARDARIRAENEKRAARDARRGVKPAQASK